ncbi:MAG: hypothetical protein MUF61_00355 [archaeon]|nr:hypothetical protein [archaeon]
MGRDFAHLEEAQAARRTKSGCRLDTRFLYGSSASLYVYPYGTFARKDIMVYVHTEGEEMPISSLEGVFVSPSPIRVSDKPGANLPCRRAQMPDF